MRDADALRDAMRRHRPKRLVTLAAITADARRERAAPGAIFEVNVGGVIAALSAAADCGVARVLHASSGSVYGAERQGRRRRCAKTSRRCGPKACTASPKQAAEAAALRLAALHGLRSRGRAARHLLRPVGSRHGRARHAECAAAGAAPAPSGGKPAVLPRPGLRDWLYVRDAAAALALLLDAAAPAARRLQPRGRLRLVRRPTGARETAARNAGLHVAHGARRRAANIDYYAPYDRAPMDIARLRADTGFVPRFDLAAAAADFLDSGAQSLETIMT